MLSIDVVKTRIQIDEHDTHLLQLIKNIYQKEGFLGLLLDIHPT